MKVLIADDHVLFRDGLRLIVEDTFPGSGIFEATNFGEALALIDRQSDIDLALVDFGMPGIDGFNGISTLRARLPSTPLVVISGREDRETILDTLRAGASGYVPKGTSRARIAQILESVFNGGIHFPQEVIEAINTMGRAEHTRESVVAALTPRQLDVLVLVGKGYSNKEIALALKLMEGTVKVHLGAIFRALGVQNRTRAAMICVKLGFVDNAGAS
ncbi:MAG: DNA-binding response regulator [Alphaproteobacteria bacterium HGW-Alphaproteobacteria-11]|nr:MAG: DNA-binding response regulator [Alphaproteobacteria bacterium HGW-Alphaproteobacteria-11]